MGGLNMEMFKMAIYIFFPVVTFYYFNVPGYHEKEVEGWRKRFSHPEKLPKTFSDTKKLAQEFLDEERSK